MLTYEIIISGRVQGVGYRNYASTIAKNLDVKGTVRNRSDGTVMIIAQTEPDIIEQFIDELRQPQHSFMKISEVTYQEISSHKTYKNFKIVY